MSLNLDPALRPRGLIYEKEYTAKPNSISMYRTSDFNMYIRPPNPDRQDEPRDDFIISGVVIVHLTKPRKVKTLRVRFLAEARLAYPGESNRHYGWRFTLTGISHADRPWEDDVIFERNLTIDDGKNGVEGWLMEAGPQRYVHPLHSAPPI